MFSKQDSQGLFSKLLKKKDDDESLAAKAVAATSHNSVAGHGAALPPLDAAAKSHAKSKSVLLADDGNMRRDEPRDDGATLHGATLHGAGAGLHERKKSVVGTLFSSLRRSKSSVKSSSSQLAADPNAPLPQMQSQIQSAHGGKEQAESTHSIAHSNTAGLGSLPQNATTAPTTTAPTTTTTNTTTTTTTTATTTQVSEYTGRISVSSRHQNKSNNSISDVPTEAVPSIPANLKRNKSLTSKKSTTSLHAHDASTPNLALGESGTVFKSDANVPPLPSSNASNAPKKSIFGRKFDFLNKPGDDATANVEPSEHAPLTKDKSFTKSMPKISLFGRKSMKGLRSATEQPDKKTLSTVGKNGIQSSSGHALDQHNTPDDSGAGGSNNGLGNALTADKRNTGLSAYEISNTQVERRYTLDDFHIVRKVGKGGFATVFLVRMKASTGRYYALKAIKKADLIKLKQEKQVINEKAILKNIKHNFIVELYHSFQDTHYLYMIIEYIDGGDLFSYLRKVQKFGEDDGRFYTCEILIALQYLHSHSIVYRDLKPENILLDTTGHVKLADFGFAKVITNTTNSFCGTPDYIAREIVRNRAYTKAVDWWSFGVLIFELVSGKTPFGDDSSEQIYENITEMKIKWHPAIKGPCKDIIKRLLEPDPTKRLGTLGDGDEIRAQPFYAKINWQKVEERKMNPPFLPACDTPEAIEKRAKRGPTEDYASMLKYANGAKLTQDLFSDAFKGF